MDRPQILAHIEQNPNVSVLIIGAGINGVGTFRDLALQGVDALIVDKGDFCSGTSAASSHMVHGGIRYLENGEFRLVREAVRERNLLLENAPHYVRPLVTTIPIFRWFSGILNAPLKFSGLLSRPSERGALVIKLGLMMYDAYTRAQGTVPGHEFLNRKAALAAYPKLNPDVIYAARYYDAAMPSPERIALELVLDAERTSDQAMALNHVWATGTAGNTVILTDELSGRSLSVRPNVVVNAAGPWIDLANHALGQTTRFIGGTKGSHIVLDHAELRAAISEHEFFFENEDGRIVLIFPFADRVLVGTSDIPVDDPEDVRCTDEEIDYFLALVGRVFPTIAVSRSDIVFSFSGVRPLPASDAKTAGQISRDHSIRTIEPENGRAFPIHALVGGKWTTFRAFSEQVTDRVLSDLGRERRDSTKSLPIGGGRDYPQTAESRQAWLADLQRRHGLSPDRSAVLFERYGTRALDVADYCAGANDAPLKHDASYSRREIGFMVAVEKACRLDDILLRRTLLGMLGRLSADQVAEIAGIMAEALDWSDAACQAEFDRVLGLLADRYGVVLGQPNPSN